MIEYCLTSSEKYINSIYDNNNVCKMGLWGGDKDLYIYCHEKKWDMIDSIKQFCFATGNKRLPIRNCCMLFYVQGAGLSSNMR